MLQNTLLLALAIHPGRSRRTDVSGEIHNGTHRVLLFAPTVDTFKFRVSNEFEASIVPIGAASSMLSPRLSKGGGDR